MTVDSAPYLLQQPPFRFVDAIIRCTDYEASTEFVIRPDVCLLDDDKLTLAGVMENMAQSCAAWMGQQMVSHGESIRLLPLCAIHRMKMFRPVTVGDRLNTTVRLMDEDFGIVSMVAESYVSGEMVAQAEIKVGK